MPVYSAFPSPPLVDLETTFPLKESSPSEYSEPPTRPLTSSRSRVSPLHPGNGWQSVTCLWLRRWASLLGRISGNNKHYIMQCNVQNIFLGTKQVFQITFSIRPSMRTVGSLSAFQKQGSISFTDLIPNSFQQIIQLGQPNCVLRGKIWRKTTD